jgi:hypothetical protein
MPFDESTVQEDLEDMHSKPQKSTGEELEAWAEG